MKPYSLRRAALLSFLPSLVLTIAIILGAALFSSYQETNRNDDAQMERLAEMLNVLARHEALEGENISLTLGGPAEQARTLAPDRVAFRIWGDHQIVTQSGSGPGIFERDYGPEGFHSLRHDQHDWRILTRIDTGNNIVVEVAQDMAARSAVFRGVAASLLWPLIIMFPAILLIIQFGLRRVLAPVRALSRDINTRDAANLEPVQPARVPQEIMPLIGAINSLMARVGDSLQRERDFTDNAAHELRTPLAALKTRAQVTSAQMGPRGRGRESMDELLTIVDRTTGLVDQMLTLARQRAQPTGRLDLSTVVAIAITQARHAPDFADHPIHDAIAPGITVMGEADMVLTLIRNLLDNAARHTPSGSSISVTLAGGTGATLTVADQGPGIAPTWRDKVLQRFVRLNTAVPGSGLGLAIVADLCSQLGAELELSDHVPHGLRVDIRFRT